MPIPLMIDQARALLAAFEPLAQAVTDAENFERPDHAAISLLRDLRDYSSGKWEATPERAGEVIFSRLFEFLYNAAEAGMIPHQRDIEITLADEPARGILLARAAAELGRAGGRGSSRRKAAASRRNGKLGGRPKK